MDFIHEHIDRKLTFISAPAGYGKTTLLVDFAHETDLSVCWYTLGSTDRDPRVFIEYLLASLASRFPGFGERTRRILEAGTSLSEGAVEVVGALVNDMVADIPEWFVLILDDFHTVENAQDMNELLSLLLNYQPEHCHLIVASRTVPGSLPFISLAARGEVVGLGEDNLRFTGGEVQELFYLHQGLRLPREEAEDLARVSEGWITGILLTSHALQSGTEVWAQARASGRPIYDFLAEEVLNQQDPELTEFLLASSTLEEMTPAFCEQILGLSDAEDRLTQLEQRNLFVVRLEERDHFRYHALFRDFLQMRLEQERPQVFRDLHRRAAVYFENLDQPERAARHYLAPGAVDEAARVIEGAAQRLLRERRLETLTGWAERLPERVLRSRPWLALHAAKAASRTGEDGGCTSDWLDMAEAAFRERDDNPSLGMVLSAQALLHFNQGRYGEGVGYAEEALSRLPSNRAAPYEAAAEAHRVKGLCLVQRGQFEEAERHLRAALRTSRELEDQHREILSQQGLAMCLEWQGRLEEAAETQHSVVESCRGLGSPGLLAEVLNDLAYHLYLAGDYEGALDTLHEALNTARDVGQRYVEAFALVSLGEVLRDLGDSEAAAESLVRGLTIAGELGQAYLSSFGREALALTYLQLGNVQEALELAQEAVDLAEERSAKVQTGRALATLGLIQVETGQIEMGVESLRRACARLEELDADKHIGRAQLFLAHALHKAGDEQEAMEALMQALPSYLTKGFEHRLLIEGQPAMPLLKKAASQDLTEVELEALLEREEEFHSLARRVLRQREEAQAAPLPSLRAYGFGGGRVERDGEPIPSSEWPTTTARNLFFYLLEHSPRSRDQIGADLWPDLRPSRLSGTFHNTKYRMQKALDVNLVEYEGGLYHLRDDLEIWYDVDEFERLLERADESHRAKAVHYMRRAIDLYTTDFLQECYDEWSNVERERLRQRYLEAVGALSQWLLKRGRFDEVIPLLRQGLRTDNLREDFQRRLMEAYARSGRSAEAIAQYERYERILQEELGISPEPGARELARAIREGRFPPSEE